MRSPFPGMDPYLEARWSGVHTRFVVYLCDALTPQLPPNLVAEVEESVIAVGDEAATLVIPDVRVQEKPSPATSPRSTASASGSPTLVSRSVPTRRLRSIRIVDVESGHRIVTAIEVLSRTNKVGKHRIAYERKTRQLLKGGASLVEFDLLRGGRHVLSVPLENFPVGSREPYRICVVRAWAQGQGEVYPAGFRERLPLVNIPLRRSDADAVIDVQQVLDEVYLKGNYSRVLDYREELVPPLAPGDARWVDERLRQEGKR